MCQLQRNSLLRAESIALSFLDEKRSRVSELILEMLALLKGGLRSEEASLLKLKRKNQWRYKSLDRKSPTPLRKRTKTGMKRSRQRKSLSKNDSLKSEISMKARDELPSSDFNSLLEAYPYLLVNHIPQLSLERVQNFLFHYNVFVFVAKKMEKKIHLRDSSD